MSSTVYWEATLYLEVRSRGKAEQRVYVAKVQAKAGEPPILHMIRQSETFAATYQSVTTWRPAEVDEQARKAVFSESLRRSDRLVDELEMYGWERRLDLEAQP